MADAITRRRFLSDVLFVGGGLLAASLLAVGVSGAPAQSPTPTPTRTPERPLPGERVAPAPAPSSTPTPSPTPQRALPGGFCPPPQRRGK